MQVAQKQRIGLECPKCPNTFMAERSFRVHLEDDHGINSGQELELMASAGQTKRKEAVLAHIRAKREEIKAQKAESRRRSKGSSNLEVSVPRL